MIQEGLCLVVFDVIRKVTAHLNITHRVGVDIICSSRIVEVLIIEKSRVHVHDRHTILIRRRQAVPVLLDLAVIIHDSGIAPGKLIRRYPGYDFTQIDVIDIVSGIEKDVHQASKFIDGGVVLALRTDSLPVQHIVRSDMEKDDIGCECGQRGYDIVYTVL